ncbi:type III pantothenate kinase [Parapusillimonas granuli]|uniref:Type III pantothenate kinase n=1 Tax=Parapusillimonas granuli TaxID=380911 RepID=A0A853G0N9_9BURK|nr:type III pantothenate kinase [Parapusillimonas granuli]MBB5215484.1 type III pantothenate kinase [Parapusillimonas granuli]MEB2400321.1 type III pantothenate kinase [Alcaligenaceae bacterium]NYT49849.1 type III pantothenate kinase [Parapusillimonas granuli]
MQVLIDAGNTRIKFGWTRRDTGERENQVLALEHNNIQQVAAWLAALPEPPRAAIGVNVAGQALARELEYIFSFSQGLAIDWVDGARTAPEVVNLYDQPAQLGPDRWVAMIGLARRLPEAPAILASFGTATTIDTLAPADPDGAAQTGGYAFQGGLILPGFDLMRASLANGTANLPHAEGGAVPFPTNTHEAIGSGIAAAQSGALLRQWRAGLAHFGRAPRIFCSGGGWPMVEDEARRALAQMQRDLGLPEQAMEWLGTPVLDGLARLALLDQEALGL